jgi:hypothetical protein
MNRTTQQMIFRAFTLRGANDKECAWRELQLRGAALSERTRARLTAGLRRTARNRDRLNRFIQGLGRVS